jgi:hypothetical protein
MIAANELRVGNWILIRDYPLLVKSISDKVGLGNETTSDFIHDHFDYTDINPIPLTTEILEKCEMVVHPNYSDCWTFIEKEFNLPATLCLCFCENRWQAADQMCNHAIGKPIKYLHQLQNLYFALTGEELPIDLKVTIEH